jgi:ABC-type polysaccharide/polyol phosphate export permease
MGSNGLRQRYARSAFGQWWIVLGTVISTTAFGLLWSKLWKLPINTFLPYVAIGHICWALITGPLGDGIAALPATSYYYANQKAPFSTVFFAGYFRNLLIFAHNAVMIPIIWLIFKTPITPQVLLFVPAVLLIAVPTISVSIIIGLVSCRYRDLGQVIGNLLQILYMVTPVMWVSSYLKDENRWVIDINPFAQMLFLLRGPLIGEQASLYSWSYCALFALVSLLFMLLTLHAVGRKVVYWL